jgi:hypothetical protein
MKFNLKEIDPVVLKQRAVGEAEKIFAKESTRQGRTYDQILNTCMYGQAAEVYMMTQGFTDNTEPYQDVIHPSGAWVEVKATEGVYYIPSVITRCVNKKKQPYTKHPDLVYIWINDKRSFEYILDGIYKWNGTTFVKMSVL